ncbi:hypothetical protein LBW59_04195 [Ralstonia solanacearum]|uniref:Carboxypeptidase regulatory-like domain-containing protein n=1 Tax=Ralstonia solanacearum TaxID=305 RepID=A0AAW5ZJU1_RALSL|nr:hypothetical protein [Ralstonia solanacearum]MBB6593105.1 hypothetical protein [Ralstonia solanacearum]MBB6597332.1 hypothetical protein [Ralstonia solanacearum]MDB0509611.1 hypothetical protein [Ralstonia solanacearum]MDB0515543.1 hypothetical protein [Ralstonia solanacearum]MDB0539970.1 hypothetical protein [Ralstonia solanacearum]
MLRVILAILLALPCAIADAAPSTSAPEAPQAGPAGPEIRYRDDIAYVSGGIGRDEVARMQAMAGRFNVRLRLVAARGGDALSDVAVSVVDARGRLRLRLVTAGPLLYLRLPPGVYRIHAEYRGAMRTVAITARRRSADVVIRLPVDANAGEWLLCKQGCPQSEHRAVPAARAGQ